MLRNGDACPSPSDLDMYGGCQASHSRPFDSKESAWYNMLPLGIPQQVVGTPNNIAACMHYRTLLVTGSSGLIGSEVATHFHALGLQIHGVDNNQRAVFFGPQGDTRWNQQRLEASLKSFTHQIGRAHV